MFDKIFDRYNAYEAAHPAKQNNGITWICPDADEDALIEKYNPIEGDRLGWPGDNYVRKHRYPLDMMKALRQGDPLFDFENVLKWEYEKELRKCRGSHFPIERLGERVDVLYLIEHLDEIVLEINEYSAPYLEEQLQKELRETEEMLRRRHMYDYSPTSKYFTR